MNNVFFSMPALSLKLPIPILWVFFIPQFKLIFPIKLKSLGYDIISEGVEFSQEVELLESFGIEMLQGYYFSKPLSEDNLLQRLGITDAVLPIQN